VKIAHFYHVYADGKWKDPLTDHIDALKEYGLYDSLNSFNVGVVGSEENANEVYDYLDSRDIQYTKLDWQTQGWEQVTMRHIPEYAKNNNGFVMYAHTKGAHDPSPINISWRKSMTYYNIVNWKLPLELLAIGYDSVGCHWCNNAFWGGTYWWASTNYIRRLSPLLYDDRWDAEHWIGQAEEKRLYDMNPGWPGFELFKTSW
jgi:hypothetical protein